MIKLVKFRFLILTILFNVVAVHADYAQVLRIAVAANAQGVVKKLQADFKTKTGISTETVVGASGKLTAQIMNGAPYDVFLSADTEFPEKLYKEGFGLQKPRIYALGRLIICGQSAAGLKNWQHILSGNSTNKIAVANPKTAPYGRAAEEALKYYKLNDQLKPKLVFAESIAQVNTYIQTGTVSFGFTTESFLFENNNRSKLQWVRVDPKSYAQIAQAAILLSYAKKGNEGNATRFFDYLSSPSAKKIISSNGYHLPAGN